MILILSNCNNQVISGQVFIDKNKNGMIDVGEKGITGIMVYTKSYSTKTNKDGHYSLKADAKDKHVMILPMPGVYPPHDKYGQPIFYKKITKTPILFSMEIKEQSDSVLLVADPQVSNSQEIDFTEQSLKLILQKIEKPGLIIFLGDLVMNDVNLFQRLKESFSRLGVPWLTLYGNHDSARSLAINEKLSAYELHFGPTDYGWSIGESRILCINNVLWLNEKSYIGGINKSQRQLLSQLASHQPKPNGLLQLMHIPLKGDPKESEDSRIEDRKFLLELGSGYQYEGSISGHSHIMYWTKLKSNHWHWNLGTLSGSWWSGTQKANGLPKAIMQDGTPPGAGLFQGWPLQERFHYVPVENHPKLKLFTPAGFVKNSRWPYQKVLLQWLGNPEAIIEYKLGRESKWEAAKQKKQFNPAYLQDYADQFTSKKVALVYPRTSSSLYEIRLPPSQDSPLQLVVRVYKKGANPTAGKIDNVRVLLK
jgi:hypothetical protein